MMVCCTRIAPGSRNAGSFYTGHACGRSREGPINGGAQTRLTHATQRAVGCLLIALIGLAVGCAASGAPPKNTTSWESSSPESLRRDVMNFADRYCSSMVAAYDELASKTPRAEAKRFAMERKYNSVASAYINATEPSAMVGLLDMVVMVQLQRAVSEDAWFTELFGENAPELVARLRVQEDDIWKLSSRYLTEAQLKELRDAIDNWRQTHPTERLMSMIRLSDFPEAKSASPSGGKGPTSVFGLLFLDPLAGLEPTRREVEQSREAVERMFFYVQRMPVLVSWRVEAVSRGALDSPQIQQFVDNTSRFADTGKSIAAVLERFPKEFSEERQRAVDDLARKTTEERSAAVAQLAQAVAAERDATIRQSGEVVASQRAAAVKQVADAVASEREALVASLNASLQSQREGLLRDVEAATVRATGRLLVGACVVVLLGVLLTMLAVLILRRYAGRGTSSGRHVNPNLTLG
jgi:hypothetical protein